MRRSAASDRILGRFAAAQGDSECRAAFGIVAGIDGAAMRVDDRPRDREADPEAVRFRRDEWCEQRAVDVRRQTRFRCRAPRLSTSAALTSVADRDATTGRRCLGHRVHGVHHQVHEHLLQEHLIAADDARDSDDRLTVASICRALMSWATRARLSSMTA